MEESLKFDSQLCTTKIQSQRLLELGLKPETADMSIITTPIDCDGIKYSLTPYSKTNHPKVFGTIPAWSLHRLIEMLDIYMEYSPYTGFNRIGNGSLYDDIIDIVEDRITEKLFKKEYLKQ